MKKKNKIKFKSFGPHLTFNRFYKTNYVRQLTVLMLAKIFSDNSYKKLQIFNRTTNKRSISFSSLWMKGFFTEMENVKFPTDLVLLQMNLKRTANLFLFFPIRLSKDIKLELCTTLDVVFHIAINLWNLGFLNFHYNNFSDQIVKSNFPRTHCTHTLMFI